MDGKHGRTTSGVTCHHLLWTAHTVERRRAWHAIIAFGKHTRSNEVGHGMTSTPLDNTYDQTTSGVTCHHRLWTTHTVKWRRAWHAIIPFGQHTRSNNVRCGIPSWPLDSTLDRTTSGVACHHSPWTANTVERCRAWNTIIAFRQHTRSNNVRRGMPSSSLGSTYGLKTSGVA